MKISYSAHARKRMKKRGVSRKDVEGALLGSQNRLFQPHGTVKCEWKRAGKKLVVVYKQNKENYNIVTAYYL